MEWGTISIASMVGMVFSLLIAVVLPIVLLILVYKKTKAKISSFFIGCGVFIVFAMMLEQILHLIVKGMTGTLLTDNVILHGMYGGLAAAVFEEFGRLFAMKIIIKRNLNKGNVLMYGVGHGGIEAILLIGLSYVSNLINAFMINFGIIQGTLSVLDESTQQITYNQLKLLWELPSWHFYLAGVERVLAMVLQIALSVLVYEMIKTERKRLFLLALFLHFAVDFLIVVTTGYGVPIWGIELMLTVLVVGIVLYVKKVCKEDTTD